MKRIPPTFKGRIFIAILCFIIFTCGSFLTFFVIRSGNVSEERLRDKGIIVVKGLAISSKSSVIAGDKTALKAVLLDIMGRETDMVYAFLYDTGGNLIASEKRITTNIDTLSENLRTTFDGEQVAWTLITSTEAGNVYDFVSPIFEYSKDNVLGYARIGLSLWSIATEKRMAISIGSLITLFLVGLGFLLSNIVATKISKPTTDLARVVAGVKTGDLTGKLSFEAEDDEIGVLAKGINDMIRKLGESVQAERQDKDKLIGRLKEYNEEILENLKSGVVVTDRKLRVLTWNHYMEDSYGMKKEEIVGKNFLRHLVKLKEEGFDSIFDRVLKGEVYRDYMVRHETATKGFRYFNVAFTPRKDNQGNVIGILMNWDDVTERKESEEKLMEKMIAERKYLQALFESVADAVISLDNENKIVEWNPAAERMFNYRKREVIGMKLDEIIASQGKLKEIASIIRRQQGGKTTVGFESVRYRKDGSPVEVMVSGAPIIMDRKVTGAVAVYKDITTKKALERQLKEAAQILENKVKDRTKELKQAYEQLKKTQEELVRKERLAVLGQLAGGVGHELRNPLGVVKNVAYFLDMKLGDSAEDKVKKHLEILNREIFNANEIITNLLDFAKVKPPKPASVNINQLINEVLAKCYIPLNVKIVMEIPEGIPKLSADPGQLERVFLNIINNAVQSMRDDGELTIKGEGYDGFVSIDISDNGEGISEEVMGKIFQPLFTTKAKGIGLGLTVSKSLLEANGGRISVKSELNKGTAVNVKLPLRDGGNG